MFFVIAEFINKNTYIRNLYVNIVEAVKVVKIIPDIEVGIKADMPLIKDGYEWNFKIPECFSSQEELDKLV
jgi:hypothetical protein